MSGSTGRLRTQSLRPRSRGRSWLAEQPELFVLFGSLLHVLGRLGPWAGTSLVGVGCQALGERDHVDHLLRADNSGWPFTPDVTPFTISLLVYPIFVLDFLLLRDRPWVRVGLVAVLFVALQVTHAIVEPPADQYGTWANGTSAVPHALGQPNLLDTASPVLGALSVAVSGLLSVAVLAALVLLAREARANQHQPAASER